MICPSCGKKTITRSSGRMLMTNPPINVVHQWCGCGYRGPDEHQRPESPDVHARRMWEEINTEG